MHPPAPPTCWQTRAHTSHRKSHTLTGHLVSAFVKQHLPLLLVDRLKSGAPVGDALSETFLEVDERLAASSIDCEFNGTTCVVAHLQVGGCVCCGVCLCLCVCACVKVRV